MKHPAQNMLTLVAGCAFSMAACGCITIAPPSPSAAWKSLTKPKIQQASYEEKVADAPGEPKHPARLKVAYGRLMEETGNLSEARKSYASAVEIQPKETDAILGLARLDQLSGNFEQAEVSYKKAVKVSPNSALAHYSLGQFYASQERWQDASDSLTKAMLAEPDDTQARYALAVALVHTGKVDAALPHFIRTIGDAEAHYNVGLILQQQGDLENAERHFALAVTKKPELVAAQNWLVHVRQERQQPAAGPETGIPNSEVSKILPAGHSSAVEPASAGPVNRPPNERKLSVQQIEQQRNQLSTSGT